MWLHKRLKQFRFWCLRKENVIFLILFLILLSMIDANEMIGTDIKLDYIFSCFMHIIWLSTDNSHVFTINCILQTTACKLNVRLPQCNVMTLIFNIVKFAIAMAIESISCIDVWFLRCNRIMIPHASSTTKYIAHLPCKLRSHGLRISISISMVWLRFAVWLRLTNIHLERAHK